MKNNLNVTNTYRIKASICGAYDPAKTKEHNNNKVAGG